jgi:structural maintenance of chromosome 1
MDAISVVLGVNSAQLRSGQLKDLVYRGQRLTKNGIRDASEPGDDENENDDEGQGEGKEGERTVKKAWVLAVYEDANKKKWSFQRTYVCYPLRTLPIPSHSHHTTSSSRYPTFLSSKVTSKR